MERRGGSGVGETAGRGVRGAGGERRRWRGGGGMSAGVPPRERAGGGGGGRRGDRRAMGRDGAASGGVLAPLPLGGGGGLGPVCRSALQHDTDCLCPLPLSQRFSSALRPAVSATPLSGPVGARHATLKSSASKAHLCSLPLHSASRAPAAAAECRRCSTPLPFMDARVVRL